MYAVKSDDGQEDHAIKFKVWQAGGLVQHGAQLRFCCVTAKQALVIGNATLSCT